VVRDIQNELFRGIFFRRTVPQLRNPGGLWDESKKLYALTGANMRDQQMEWVFPSGAWVKMSGCEHDKDVFAHQGAQYAFVGIDELTHFSAFVFWYLVSRLRSMSGVRPRVRATCNPDPKSWVKEFIGWWLDAEGRYADPAKAGRIRWFVRDSDEIVWADTPEELQEARPHLFEDVDDPRKIAMSVTFIPAKLDDNQELLKKDPAYRAKLRAQDQVTRAQLEDGDWKTDFTAGMLFREEWFEIVELHQVPDSVRRIRYWDLAGSKRRRSDFTAGVALGETDGIYFVLDVRNQKQTPYETEQLLKGTAGVDGRFVPVHVEQEAGAGAAIAMDHLRRNVLKGYDVQTHEVRGEGTKIDRARPASSAAQAGHVKLVRGPWNRVFLDQVQSFPDGSHDDVVDAFSGAFNALQQPELAYVSV